MKRPRSAPALPPSFAAPRKNVGCMPGSMSWEEMQMAPFEGRNPERIHPSALRIN